MGCIAPRTDAPCKTVNGDRHILGVSTAVSPGQASEAAAPCHHSGIIGPAAPA